MKAKDRVVRASQDEAGTILIAERTAYVPLGYSRRKWNEERITVSVEELRTLAKKYLPEAPLMSGIERRLREAVRAFLALPSGAPLPEKLRAELREALKESDAATRIEPAEEDETRI